MRSRPIIPWLGAALLAGWAGGAAPAAGPAAAPPALASWRIADPDALPDDAQGREVRYGRDLIAHTSVLLGRDAPDPADRFTGNGLDCASCHLDAGTRQFALPLAGVWRRYPAFSARLGKVQSLAKRVNDCMERSMNGRPLSEDGPAMAAILAYLKFIGTPPDAAGRGVPRLPLPERAADPVHGKSVYQANCAPCHQANGGGVRYSASDARTHRQAYMYPPLWGPQSHNDGAGMARNIAAAWFIRANMPRGTTFADPVLSPADAYDVAAYVNQHPRPHKPGLAEDYPDRWLKPADAAFPPLFGPFAPVQHELGPWPPIIDWLHAHAPGGALGPSVD